MGRNKKGTQARRDAQRDMAKEGFTTSKRCSHENTAETYRRHAGGNYVETKCSDCGQWLGMEQA